MATYFVDNSEKGNDSGDGSSAHPWKTLGKAEAQVKAGDEVHIRPGKYREALQLNKANTTWKAADSANPPVLDGGYHEGLFRPDGTLPHPDAAGGFLPSNSNGAMVSVREEGITIDGLTLQNLAGAGFAVSAGKVTIRNCKIDFTYNTPIRVNPGAKLIDKVVVENNTCTRSSMQFYDHDRTGSSPQNVSGVIKMGRTRDGVIRNNICANGFGEGINVGKGSYRTLVEGNIVHTCLHVHIYINRSVDTVVRNNLLYHTYNKELLGINGRPPAGIVIGDENTKTDAWPSSAGGEIYNNIVIGLGTLFAVRNGNHYNTQLNKCYIAHNTFIGGSKTDLGIQIAGNQFGRPHRDSLFENNVISNVRRPSQITGDTSGITFRNNLWSQQPEQAARGPNDRIGDPGLVNVTAAIQDSYPNYATNLDPKNYKLTTRSALAVGLAETDRNFPGFPLPIITHDFFGVERGDRKDIGAHEYDGEVVEGPKANFSIGSEQDRGTAPHTVDFLDRSTSARPIVAYVWDFGDGHTSGETTQANTQHTYNAPGSYNVTLTIKDDRGQKSEAMQPGVVTVLTEEAFIIPPPFRRFAIVQKEEEKLVALAFGTQYPDMRAILVWHKEPHHMLNFASIDHVMRSLVVPDRTEFRWIDLMQEEEMLTSEEEDEEALESIRVFIPG